MVTVIGGGNGAKTIAGVMAAREIDVKLFSFFKEEINTIKDREIIIENKESGVLKKTFIKGVTSNIFEAVKESKYIIMVIPSNFHKEAMKKLIKHLTPQNILILMPGRTYGCIEFKRLLKEEKKADVLCLETQTFPYACRAELNKVIIYGQKTSVMYSAIDILNNKVISEINDILPELKYEESYLKVTLNNIGALLHPIPTICNFTKIERKESFKYYSEGLTPKVLKLLNKIEKEKKEVLKKLGVENIDLLDWLKLEYNVQGDNIIECVNSIPAYKNLDAPNTLNHRYLLEDIVTGLGPLYLTGKILELKMENLEKLLNFLEILLERDLINQSRTITLEELKGVRVYEI